MDMSKYRDIFLAESRDHLSQANRMLEALAAGDRNDAAIHDLFRHAHSLKGMATSMGFSPVATFAHRLEDVLDLLRTGQAAPDEDLLELLHRGFDQLATQVDVIEAGGPPPAADPALAHEMTCRGAGPADTPHPEPSASIRVDLVYVPNTVLPAARALVALERLGTLGTIVSTDPPRTAIEAGEFGGRLRVHLAGERSVAEVRAVSESLTDVHRVTVRAEDAAAENATATGSVDALPQTVRVRTRHLDRLLELIGELIVQRGRLESQLAGQIPPPVQETLEKIARRVGDLHHTIMDLRMLPFETVTLRLERTVRELARELGRKVVFTIEGREVGLDRSLLSEITDPLQHLLRNALDHGIEAPEERRAAGKPEAGRLRLRLDRRGDAVLLSLEDDGRGMDPDAIRRAALDRGLVDPERLARLDEEETLALVTRPGFSTAERITDVSGRGVGLDVVRTRIDHLGGHLQLQSRRGQGTAVLLTLPLTVSVVDTLLVEARGRAYGVPLTTVQGTTELQPDAVQYRAGQPYLVSEGNGLPLYDLGDLLHDGGEPDPFRQSRPVLLFRVGEHPAGMVVDEVRGKRDLVVKPLGTPLELLPELTGASILNDGNLALILDLEHLVRSLPASPGGA
jgi:two-component system chemotaxis sensor kinase CheA